MTSVTYSAALVPCVRIRAFFPCSLLAAENSFAFDKRAFVIQTALQLPDVLPELQLPTSSCGPTCASGTLDQILVDESGPALVLQPAEEVEMEEVDGGGDDEEQEAGGDGMDMEGEKIEGQVKQEAQNFFLAPMEEDRCILWTCGVLFPFPCLFPHWWLEPPDFVCMPSIEPPWVRHNLNEVDYLQKASFGCLMLQGGGKMLSALLASFTAAAFLPICSLTSD